MSDSRNHPVPFSARTAGEVRFIKDRGGDKGEWAWNTPGPSQREIEEDFAFNARHLKPLAMTLRATLMSMGHAITAYNAFTRIKSADVSPDGNLGGKGYIQKIADMRRQYMNIVEAMSSLSDTLYDEINAPHWHPEAETGGPREREEVREIMDDAEEIRQDPEGWAEDAEAHLDADPAPAGRPKKASSNSDDDALFAAYFGRSTP